MISIVIPARNEEAYLGKTLVHLRKCILQDEAEIIVAEGGSEDRTADVAMQWARLVHGEDCTRAALMNAGARAARGDVILFLHADSFPPSDFIPLIRSALANPEAVGGAFDHQFLEPSPGLRLVSEIDRLRFRLTKNHFGDQGIFVRREIFHRLGGFPNWGILEDLEFSKRMRGFGRTVLIRKPVVTSGRRFLKGGITRTFIWIAMLLLRERLGVDTERYAAAYRKENECRNGTLNPQGAIPD